MQHSGIYPFLRCFAASDSRRDDAFNGLAIIAQASFAVSLCAAFGPSDLHPLHRELSHLDITERTSS